MVFLFSLVFISGCGYDPFAPPSRPKSIVSVAEVKKAVAIYYVVPGVPTGGMQMWGIEAQREANDHQAIFRIIGPGPGDSNVTLAETVRRAVGDGASALIVVPDDSKDLPKALTEAEAQNVPVVLLGKSIQAPAGSKPFTVVDHALPEPFAKRIVSTVLDDLKKIKRAPEGTVLLVTDQKADEGAARRVEALKTAATAAGLTKLVTVSIDSEDLEQAKKTIREAVKAHPDVVIALADGTESMYAVSQVRIELKGNPHFLLGGFSAYRLSMVQAPFLLESCFVDGRYEELARLAVLTALKKVNGEPVGELVEQGPRFTKGSALVSSEFDPNSIPRMQKNEAMKELIKDIAPPLEKIKPQ